MPHRAASSGVPARQTADRLALEAFADALAPRGQQVFAAVLCVACAAVSLAVLPFANQPMASMPGFYAINQSALLIVYLLTAWLLFTQVRHDGSAGLLLLGAGQLYTALILGIQIVATPGLLRPGLIIGTGPETMTLLWSFWHFGPPAVAIAYAIQGDGKRIILPQRLVAMTRTAVALTVLAAAACGVVACTQVNRLPRMLDADGGYWSLTTSGVGPALIVLTLGALAVLWARTRLRTVLQLWLGVSLLLLLLDNAVTDLGAARNTVGWFAGRMEALLSGLVMLAVYLRQIDGLYQQAVTAARTREALRLDAQAARENLEIALDASGMGDWELDLTTGTARRTPRTDQLLGAGPDTDGWWLARLVDQAVPEDRDALAAAIEAALADGDLAAECRIQRADTGAVRWIALHGRTYFDPSGHPVTMAGCLMDVTERHQTEERLRQAERMEAVGQLTGGVAHDFNNLLTVILGNLDLIVRRPGDAARVERLASNALIAGRRGTELTDKLLAFSRRQIVAPQTLNLNRVIGEFTALIKQAVGEAVEVSLVLDPGLDPARLDQSQFQAVLLNLAGNARDAMPSGGTLQITTRNVTATADDVAGVQDARPGQYLQVTIADTGTGMDAATAARAFEPFFTTKEVGKGTGLGLSQVYGFVRQAGGFCRVRTAPGEGCAVDLFLPRSSDETAGMTSHGLMPLRAASGSEVVLVVEDEDALREMAAESLDQLGYHVLTAPNARMALDVLRGPTRIDVLFSDVVMPGGMNGAQLAVQAREIRPDLKVLLTSGYINTATAGTRELPEGVPLLRKPYIREELAAKLQTVIAAEA